MLRIGCCSNPLCQVDYRVVGLKEFLVKFKHGEIRVYSVCQNCFDKLNSDIVKAVINEDKEYCIRQAECNILYDEATKVLKIMEIKQKRLSKWAKRMDDL